MIWVPPVEGKSKLRQRLDKYEIPLVYRFDVRIPTEDFEIPQGEVAPVLTVVLENGNVELGLENPTHAPLDYADSSDDYCGTTPFLVWIEARDENGPVYSPMFRSSERLFPVCYYNQATRLPTTPYSLEPGDRRRNAVSLTSFLLPDLQTAGPKIKVRAGALVHLDPYHTTYIQSQTDWVDLDPDWLQGGP